MRMTGERRLDAPREAVWRALNDAETLRAAIPGCTSLVADADGAFRAEATAKVGPVKAAFAGTLRLADVDAPNGYRLIGEGQGGAAGFARGEATVRLAEDGTATVLAYDVDAEVGGRLAQVGARVVDAAAAKMAEAFFDRFEATLTVAEPAPEPQPEPEPSRGLPPLVWAAGLIVLVAILLAVVAT